MKRMTQVLAIAAITTAFAAATVWAQAPVRVRGTIEKVDGDLLMVKARDGADLKLKLKPDASVRGVVKATLADIKAGVMVGITSMPQADGTLKAVEIHIFPAGQNVNQNHGPWDLLPNSTMTNGAVQASVAGVDGQVLTVTYKRGDSPPEEKKIIVTPQTIIAGYDPATKADLKAGQRIFVANSTKLPDGTLEVASIAYGKDIAPPM
jgi:hypothetical protein